MFTQNDYDMLVMKIANGRLFDKRNEIKNQKYLEDME